MIHSRRVYALFCALLCGLISSCSIWSRHSNSHDAPKVIDLNSREQSLAQYIHAPTLLFLWASWCPECLVEIDNLDTVKEKLAGHNVQIVAVAISDTLEGVLAFPPVKRAPFPVLIDIRSQVRDRYPVSGLPTTYLLDHTGKPRRLIDPEDGQEKKYVMGFREWQSAAGIKAITDSLDR